MKTTTTIDRERAQSRTPEQRSAQAASLARLKVDAQERIRDERLAAIRAQMPTRAKAEAPAVVTPDSEALQRLKASTTRTDAAPAERVLRLDTASEAARDAMIARSRDAWKRHDSEPGSDRAVMAGHSSGAPATLLQARADSQAAHERMRKWNRSGQGWGRSDARPDRDGHDGTTIDFE